MSQQLGFEFGEPDPWTAWIERPLTSQTRLDDLVLQIKRDAAVLAGDPVYCTDREFYESRIAAMRLEAQSIIPEGVS